MGLTRSKVESGLKELDESARNRGVRTAGANGEELSPEVVDSVYRDAKKCVFCKKRSDQLCAEMVTMEPHHAQLVPGPSERHLRLLTYGLCRGHATLAEKDPAWRGRLRLVASERMRHAARRAGMRN